MFVRRLAEYINASSDIDDITAYAESFPATKLVSPHTVGVITAGGTRSSQGRSQSNLDVRFMVSGTAETAIDKAEEIYRFFYPPEVDSQKPFKANEYSVAEVLAENGEPRIAKNIGNIFYASFVLRFLVARGH